jgi:hypothetical protein
MWEMVIELFWPSRRSRLAERLEAKLERSGTLRVEYAARGDFKRALNASGWLTDEVVAAGDLRQGKVPSLLAMLTGAALFEVLRPRRSKSLPREFVLAITADRVVAFGLSVWKEGVGESSVSAVRIKPGELGSWPRGSLALRDRYARMATQGGMLEVAGGERFPVTWTGDPNTDELIDLLPH